MPFVKNHECQWAVKNEVLTLSTAYEVDYELVMVQFLWDHVGWQIIQFNVKLTHNTIFSYLWIRDFMNFMMKKNPQYFDIDLEQEIALLKD